MTGWCGAQGAGWSPWRVVGRDFENHWAVSMQNEKWISGTTAVLRLPNSQVGLSSTCREESWDVCGFYGRVLSVFSLHLDAQTSALGRMGKKKILVLLLQQVLEPGKKWRSCLPLTLVLAWSVFEDESLTIHFCLISVMRPLLNPWSPTRWMRHWRFAYWVSGLGRNNQSSSRTDQHS